MEIGVAGAQAKGSTDFKEFLEGERLAKLLGNLERGVQGPYFYGDKPSNVDFFWTNVNDWQDNTWQNRVVSEFGGKRVTAAFPKLQGVLDGIRSLESYKACEIPIIREGFGECKDDLFEAWKV